MEWLTSISSITASLGTLQKRESFSLDFLSYGLFGSTNQNVGLDPDLTKFGHALLGWLCF